MKHIFFSGTRIIKSYTHDFNTFLFFHFCMQIPEKNFSDFFLNDRALTRTKNGSNDPHKMYLRIRNRSNLDKISFAPSSNISIKLPSKKFGAIQYFGNILRRDLNRRNFRKIAFFFLLFFVFFRRVRTVRALYQQSEQRAPQKIQDTNQSSEHNRPNLKISANFQTPMDKGGGCTETGR